MYTVGAKHCVGPQVQANYDALPTAADRLMPTCMPHLHQVCLVGAC